MSERQPYPKDYATLIPVLVGISRVFDPRRVLEYGAGLYSTPLFLNRAVFPLVEELTSNEHDGEWIRKVQSEGGVGGDERLKWFYGENYLLPDNRYDLILIDAEEEQKKIRIIQDCGKFAHSPVVVHDTDHGPYAQTVRNSFEYFVRFDAFNPYTTVAWNGQRPLLTDALLRVSNVLYRYWQDDPTDVNHWIEIFQVPS